MVIVLAVVVATDSVVLTISAEGAIKKSETNTATSPTTIMMMMIIGAMSRRCMGMARIRKLE